MSIAQHFGQRITGECDRLAGPVLTGWMFGCTHLVALGVLAMMLDAFGMSRSEWLPVIVSGVVLSNMAAVWVMHNGYEVVRR